MACLAQRRRRLFRLLATPPAQDCINASHVSLNKKQNSETHVPSLSTYRSASVPPARNQPTTSSPSPYSSTQPSLAGDWRDHINKPNPQQTRAAHPRWALGSGLWALAPPQTYAQLTSQVCAAKTLQAKVALSQCRPTVLCYRHTIHHTPRQNQTRLRCVQHCRPSFFDTPHHHHPQPDAIIFAAFYRAPRRRSPDGNPSPV